MPHDPRKQQQQQQQPPLESCTIENGGSKLFPSNSVVDDDDDDDMFSMTSTQVLNENDQNDVMAENTSERDVHQQKQQHQMDEGQQQEQEQKQHQPLQHYDNYGDQSTSTNAASGFPAGKKQSILFGDDDADEDDIDDENGMDVNDSMTPSTTMNGKTISDSNRLNVSFKSDIEMESNQGRGDLIASSRRNDLGFPSSSSGLGDHLTNFDVRQQNLHHPQQDVAFVELISRIILPSPFPHHNSGPTSSRFRNMLYRVSVAPLTDVEAWQALLTEVNLCYRNILPNLHHPSVGSAIEHGNTIELLHAKLDWIESCYGTLLKHFPYASSQYVTIIEMLLTQSARFGEEGGPSMTLSTSSPNSPFSNSIDHDPFYGTNTIGSDSQQRQKRRALLCEAKVENLFRFTLGVQMDGTMLLGTAPNAKVIPSSADDKSSPSFNDNSMRNGMCVWVVELWLLYIRKVERDAKRKYDVSSSNNNNNNNNNHNSDGDTDTNHKHIREVVVKAYETAISNVGFTLHNNHLIWRKYIEYVKSWTTSTSSVSQQQLQQAQMVQLRSVYQRLVMNPMTGLDQLWQEYEAFERSQSEALAQALLSEYAPKYQNARTCYLERNRVYSSVDLQLSRLATPPVDCVFGDSSTSGNNHSTNSKDDPSGTGANVMAGTTDDGKHTSSTSASIASAGDRAIKLEEEYRLLKLWKTRCSYERTNPLRLDHFELCRRIRHTYKEMCCVLTRHPECWHMWSTWEITTISSSSDSIQHHHRGGTASNIAATGSPVDRAIAVLQLGQEHIPDCTFLAYSEAHIVELYCATSNEKHNYHHPCLTVMERFIQRNPNTLAFVIYQQMVRRYKGRDAARAVFAQARRTLLSSSSNNSIAAAIRNGASNILGGVGDDKHHRHGKLGMMGVVGGVMGDSEAVAGDAADLAKDLNQKSSHSNKQRYMVTNRLDPSIGSKEISANGCQPATVSTHSKMADPSFMVHSSTPSNVGVISVGPITWHLYASHATMEHRLNRCPDVAARVYELGLRKHSSFLTIPSYVYRYAQLLLELNDVMNLRALLTRAVAACNCSNGDYNDDDIANEIGPSNESGANNSSSSGNRSALASMWDMSLYFESIIGGDDPSGVATIHMIERRRREALMGPEIEDVGNGGFVGMDGETVPLIGAQKTTLSEQLLRTEGYDTSSRIVNGLCRTVDVFNVMGIWGDGGCGSGDGGIDSGGSSQDFEFVKKRIRTRQRHTTAASFRRASGTDEYSSGGKSDMAYQKRLNYHYLVHSGLSVDGSNTLAAGVGGGPLDGSVGVGTSKMMLSARERMLQQQQQQQTGGGGGTAIMLAIQQSPEWLRSLLLLLPASKLRLPIVAKPPPHLIEMALSQLRLNTLPAERPSDDSWNNNNGNKNDSNGGNFGSSSKRRGGGGGSSDEDDDEGSGGGSGYSIAFRARQRARMTMQQHL